MCLDSMPLIPQIKHYCILLSWIQCTNHSFWNNRVLDTAARSKEPILMCTHSSCKSGHILFIYMEEFLVLHISFHILYTDTFPSNLVENTTALVQDCSPVLEQLCFLSFGLNGLWFAGFALGEQIISAGAQSTFLVIGPMYFTQMLPFVCYLQTRNQGLYIVYSGMKNQHRMYIERRPWI